MRLAAVPVRALGRCRREPRGRLLRRTAPRRRSRSRSPSPLPRGAGMHPPLKARRRLDPVVPPEAGAVGRVCGQLGGTAASRGLASHEAPGRKLAAGLTRAA
jgi:hypothetical protein